MGKKKDKSVVEKYHVCSEIMKTDEIDDKSRVGKDAIFDTIVRHVSIPVAARLLGLRVRISPRAWIFVSCVCCVGNGLCVGDLSGVFVCVIYYVT
jgi:hypothetical protein